MQWGSLTCQYIDSRHFAVTVLSPAPDSADSDILFSTMQANERERSSPITPESPTALETEAEVVDVREVPIVVGPHSPILYRISSTRVFLGILDGVSRPVHCYRDETRWYVCSGMHSSQFGTILHRAYLFSGIHRNDTWVTTDDLHDPANYRTGEMTPATSHEQLLHYITLAHDSLRYKPFFANDIITERECRSPYHFLELVSRRVVRESSRLLQSHC